MDQPLVLPHRIDRLARLRGALLAAGLAALAACGGGGGAAPTPGPATVSGTARYEAVPMDGDGVGLNYAATAARPIRGATVQLLDGGGNVIAATVTDANGAYQFALAGPQDVQVRVRAELKRSGGGGASYDVTVRDNTASNALYVLDSGLFMASGSASRNLTAASGWGGAGYTGTRAAAPFAILDVAYQGVQKVLTVAPAAALPALRVFWSRNNQPASGSLGAGQIGTSFFSAGASGGPALYLLGAENTDTDEYDDHVVAHELGHFLQYALSRDDSIGGSHTDGDKLDMRVAFSEGFGNAWSGMALGSPIYADSTGPGQAGGFFFNVAEAPAALNRGWYSEDSLQYLLYAVHQDAALGFGPIYAALGQLRTAPTFSSAYSMAAALKAAAPSAAATVDALWQGQAITGTDAYGSGESNTGFVAGTLPVYRAHSNGAPQYCLTGAVGEYNKLGNTLFVRFTIASGGSHVITLSRSSNTASPSDPDFTLLRSDGSTVDAISSTVDVETLSTTLSAGTHALALTDYNLVAGETRCVDLVVN